MGPKRNNLTLNLNAATNGGGGSSKQSRGGGGGGGILTSPDVNKLGLTSPQIKQLLKGGGLTPTPGAGPSGYIFPPTTSTQGQQELLVKQFAEAQKAQSVPTTRAAKQMSGGGLLLPSTIAETVSADQPERPQSSASSSDASDQLEIKQEPEEEELTAQQPSKGKGGRKGSKGRKGAAGAFAPVNMDNQEMMKLERKRSRNRVAATKCRKKKLEKISKLEDKVNHLKGENTVLASTLKQLKENVCNLKQEIMAHVNQGCKIDTSS